MNTVQFTYDENIFSDLHKDAYGFRPRAHEFYEATPERKQQIWDATVKDLECAMAEDKARQDNAVQDFEKSVASLITKGAGDRATAIRWIIEATTFTKADLMYGGGYLCYEFGLPYEGYTAEFNEVLKVGVNIPEE